MNDACCVLCRTPSGVCASKGTCEHHRVSEAQDEADHRTRRTHNDPTADAAIGNAMRGKRYERKPR